MQNRKGSLYATLQPPCRQLQILTQQMCQWQESRLSRSSHPCRNAR